MRQVVTPACAVSEEAYAQHNTTVRSRFADLAASGLQNVASIRSICTIPDSAWICRPVHHQTSWRTMDDQTYR